MKTLKHYGSRILEGSAYLLKRAVMLTAGAYVIGATLAGNGCMDSGRTRLSAKLHDSSNPIKAVKSVSEEWTGTEVATPTMDGYNPRVKRNVVFEDGSKTTLLYHTLAWEPFRTWMGGEKFEPKPGEQYEVTTSNELVRKVRSFYS